MGYLLLVDDKLFPCRSFDALGRSWFGRARRDTQREGEALLGVQRPALRPAECRRLVETATARALGAE